MIAAGQAFRPLSVRVTDAATPPNPVRGAAVVFEFTWMRPVHDDGETTTGSPPPDITRCQLSSARRSLTVVSDADGIATVSPTAGTLSGPLEAETKITTAAAQMNVTLQSAWSMRSRHRTRCPTKCTAFPQTLRIDDAEKNSGRRKAMSAHCAVVELRLTF